MTDLRCGCGKMLGERNNARLIIRRLGLVLVGGVHTWTCDRCGRKLTIDLDAVDIPAPQLHTVAVTNA